MNTFYFIRHPQTVAEEGVCYGVTDLLPRTGEVERIATKLSKTLPWKQDRQIISSPLQRCQLLAKELANGSPIHTSALIKEIDFGTWEMKQWSDIPSEEQKVWTADYLNQAPYGGESFGDVVERVTTFWDEATNDLTTDKIIVTHAGVMRALLVILLEASPYKIFATDVQYGDVIRVEVYSKEYYKIRTL